MLKIFKYNINPFGQTLELPEDTKILSIQSQFDEIVLYASKGNSEKQKDFNFVVFPTGEIQCSDDRKERLSYLGTVLLLGGHLVYHVYLEKFD